MIHKSHKRPDVIIFDEYEDIEKMKKENSSDPTDTPVSVVVDGLISTIIIIAALLGTYYVYFR